MELPTTSNMQVASNTLRVELGDSAAPAIRVLIVRPPVLAEYVTHRGQVVTYQGEAVYVFVEE